MVTRYGEMGDMISCFAIFRGNAKPKRKKRTLSFEEALKLR